MRLLGRTALLPVFLVLAPLASSASEISLETDEDRTLYALGFALARTLKPLAFSERELEIIVAGIRDSTLSHEPRIEVGQYAAKMRALSQTRKLVVAGFEKKEGTALVERMAKEAGAVRLPSGMVYRVIQEGSGESPSATDTVRVHYHGTLRDGNVFDSSLKRGPATFALNRVIKCWTEGVQKMKAGGKSLLTCPPDLAYGDRGQGGIPPGATLMFEVELLEIVN
ncbi:MAG: FKBP-type peptidyl-prolyl cis-trans isomerase [Myxococcota bacterium]